MSVEIEIPCPDPSMVVLVANRGEIARRVIRSADDWGVQSVAIHADPDADAPHVRDATTAVRIGPAALDRSYLSVEAILAAAEASGATYVHPGYGFLAEHAGFADAVIESGRVWAGPRPEAIRRMGSKIEARRIAQSAGVPVIPGYNDSQDEADLTRAAESIGFPVLVKASAGGGGKGIRIASMPDEFAAALHDARAEADRAFGDDAVIVERYIERPRHIEVQVVGDAEGTIIDLGTRECSVQRRYQKVLEEAPAPNLDVSTEGAIRHAAIELARAIDYDSVGTVEFILDDDSGDWFFLEMNTRIQVEHTVTEEITGVDLVQLQIAVAGGAPIPAAVRAAYDNRIGHAIEVRVNAENPWAGFVPDTGRITRIDVPTDSRIRWDGAVEIGSVVSAHYDSLIGKLIVHGTDRLDALGRLGAALAHTTIEGVETTVDFHRWLVAQSAVRTGRVTTRFLDETPLPRSSPYARGPVTNPWNRVDAPRLTPHRSAFAFESPTRDLRWDSAAASATTAAGTITSPFPGLVTDVLVSAGDEVIAGQPLLTIEAMKMLHPITASGAGVIAAVEVVAGDQVAAGDPLVSFSEHKEVT